MWSQNIQKDAKFGHKLPLKKKFSKKVILQFFIIFSKFFTIFFMGSEVCLERCDSYSNFGYFEKKITLLF